MILLKEIVYSARLQSKSDIRIFNRKTAVSESVDKSGITDLDKDIDNIILNECDKLYSSILDNLVLYNYYDCVDDVISLINKNKLIINMAVIYTDVSKAIKGYDDKYTDYKTNSEYFKECARSVSYIINYNYKYKKRYECYGLYSNCFLPDDNRYELSDYQDRIERYKVGDIVQFKYPLCGYKSGVITTVLGGMNNPREGRLYEVMCGDGKTLTEGLFYDDAVHHDDIEKVIGHDDDLAAVYTRQLEERI